MTTEARTPQEWVDLAFACGMAPYFHQQPDEEWALCMKGRGVDRSRAPSRCLDEWWDEVFAILDSMGRVIRAEDIKPEG